MFTKVKEKKKPKNSFEHLLEMWRKYPDIMDIYADFNEKYTKIMAILKKKEVDWPDIELIWQAMAEARPWLRRKRLDK